MKYLYCPRCKQLHVKPWFAIRDRCPNCLGEATAIPIPANWMTYTKYVLYVLIPALIVVYLQDNVKTYLYLALVLLFAMFIIAYLDIARADKYAKERIKVAVIDSEEFNARGRR